jgi:hypothetical protein
MNKKELMTKLKSLGKITKEQRNEVVCSLIGHSNIDTICFGYRNCGRCGVQLGDNLGSIDYGRDKCVIIGHNCKTCRKNYKEQSTWADKLYVKNPFKKVKK